MAVQPQTQHDQDTAPYLPAASFQSRLDEDNDNDFPLSSQESVMTTASTNSMPRQRAGQVNNNKRSFSDEEDDNEEDVMEMTMSMQSMTSRRMAMPRGVGVGGWVRDVKRTVSSEAEMDFEEVDWLVPNESR